MNKEINQKISELMDDELTHSESENLLVKIIKNSELKNKINRYQLMSHVLRSDDFMIADKGFAEKIKQELNKEVNYLLPKQTLKKTPLAIWKKTSIALAASIAVVAVIFFQHTELQDKNLQQQIALITVEQSDEAQIKAEEKKQPSQHERFKAYLQAHSDDLYTHGSLNIHPLATVVSSYGQD